MADRWLRMPANMTAFTLGPRAAIYETKPIFPRPGRGGTVARATDAGRCTTPDPAAPPARVLAPQRAASAHRRGVARMLPVTTSAPTPLHQRCPQDQLRTIELMN
jgi:hypothetical protein